MWKGHRFAYLLPPNKKSLLMKFFPNWNTTKFFPLVKSLQADALVENGILIRRNKFKIRYITAYLENVKAEMGDVVR